MKILIVDDSKHIRNQLKTILSSAGYQDLIFAQSALEAFEILDIDNQKDQTEDIDLILMDVLMPEINGIEACSKIKATQHLADIPIIIVTGLSDVENLGLAFDAGAIDYIVKPVNQLDLLCRVRSSLKLSSEIKDRKWTEKALRESEEKYRSVVELASDGICISQNYVFKYVNPQFARLLGYLPVELIGTSVDLIIPTEMKHKFKSNYDGRLAGIETSRSYEAIFLEKNGLKVEVEINSAIISFESQPAVLDFIRDIRERKEIEEENIKIRKLESVGILAGGIAHDFNNLLTAILGNTSLAKMYIPPDNKAFEKLNESEKAVLRAKDLTQKLLTFSKGGTPIKKTTQLREIIKDSVEFHLSGSNIRCEYQFADDLFLVECDPIQINQAIGNIVLNAKESMPQGGNLFVSVQNKIFEVQESLLLNPGKYLLVSIKDKGCGIARENLSRIFDPYFSTKAKGTQKGTGMGLTLAHSIIKKHGGNINVESEISNGTIIYVYLPAIEEVGDNDTDAPITPSGKTRGKEKVLLMDDEEIIRSVAGEILEYLGYEVIMVNDGQEAVDAYKSALKLNQPFDAVILDLTIPGGMGGKECIETLLKFDPDVKAIVSSGYSNDPIMADYKQYGFSGIVTKPYKIQDLKSMLADILDRTNT